MAPSAQAVDRLRAHLVEILDDADADTLVSVFDTSELATRHDLELLSAKIETLKHELIGVFRGEINAAITAQTRPLLITIFGTAVVFAGSMLAAVLLLA
jgi:hypothetical protein